MRLIKPGLTAADQIGLDIFGKPIWLLSGHDDDDTNPPGADDDDSDDDSGEDDDEDDDDDDDDSSDDDDDKKSKGGKKKGKHAKDDDDDDEDDDDKPMYSKREYDRMRNRMRAADKRASDAEAKLSRRGTRKPPADDKPVDDGERKRAEQAEARAKQLTLENAFFRANDVDWVDPTDALKLVDLSDVDVDEDGTVDTKALARALKTLAKRKPHLVKAKKSSGPADGEGDAGTDQGSGRTAPKLNGKRSGRKPSTKDELANRFSVLRNR